MCIHIYIRIIAFGSIPGIVMTISGICSVFGHLDSVWGLCGSRRALLPSAWRLRPGKYGGFRKDGGPKTDPKIL